MDRLKDVCEKLIRSVTHTRGFKTERDSGFVAGIEAVLEKMGKAERPIGETSEEERWAAEKYLLDKRGLYKFSQLRSYKWTSNEVVEMMTGFANKVEGVGEAVESKVICDYCIEDRDKCKKGNGDDFPNCFSGMELFKASAPTVQEGGKSDE